MIDFPVYRNDGVKEHMRALIDLKNIVARQLPKMPKEYITRLVMDRKHESMLVVRKSSSPSKVIGGVVYRPFVENEFVEIAFLAVSAIEQVKGYGTRLMNKLKAHLQKSKVKYIVTYADNNAIGYFKKQGFSTIPRMPKHLWYGYIKEYDSGTLMDCYLNPGIDYNDLSNELKKQKAMLLEALKKSYHFEIHKGSEIEQIQKGIKKKHVENDLTTEKVFNKIPGLTASGWTLQSYIKSLHQSDRNSFFKQCQNILKQLNNHCSSWPFKKPVNPDEVPDYTEVIKHPRDLESIGKRLESKSHYRSKENFVKDVQLIFDNAKLYNKPNSIYYKHAVNLEEYIRPYLDQMTEPTEAELKEYDRSLPHKDALRNHKRSKLSRK
eukprot:TRINITY_DN9089_c0_g1_i3.p1 TRINITY_DN9089_c0_g1~~TRINITY_DN9089_c0_g1_i3.p1  ORF type:complete len:379 (-),score=116.73 TRINITY_DN9089_c0_g1_i3:191-1327(-)